MLASSSRNRRQLTRRCVIRVGIVAAASSSGLSRWPRTRAASAQATPIGTPLAGSDSPVGRQFAWVLDRLNNGGAGMTDQVVAERFHEAFLDAVPARQLIGVFGQLAAIGPFTSGEYSESPDGLEARAILSAASGERLELTMRVEPDPPHSIVGLLFQPAAAGTPEALASWDELDRQWSALAPAAGFLAAEVVDGDCVPVHALNPELRLAIGSAFKLYILGELADQVRAGAVEWDDRLAIRDDWKASFSGPMNQLEAGEERTLREFAEQMISVSDNTATDHLLFHLGQENVEAIQAVMGHGEPELNQPMLSTQEMFQLKLAAPDELRDAYLAGSVAERRRLLDGEVGDLNLSFWAASGWTEPILIDQIEWFASAEDLCRAMATLDAWAAEPGLEPITEILGINPGTLFDLAVWEYIDFKGGSELGVLNLTWLLRRVDGRTFVLTGSLNNTEGPIDEDAAVAMLQAAAQRLASA